MTQGTGPEGSEQSDLDIAYDIWARFLADAEAE